MEEAVAEIVVLEKPKKGRKPKADKVSLVVDTQQEAEEAYARQLLEVVSGWDLTTQDEMTQAGALLAEVVARKKDMAESLKAITEPIRAAEAAARKQYKVRQQLCDQAELALKQAIGNYERKRIAAQNEALKAVAESGGTADPRTLVVAHGHDQLELAAQVSARTVHKFRVIDSALIPEKYFVRILNEKMIQEEIKLTEGRAEIAGIEVYQDVQIVNKAVR